jgi:hypothetical protein
MNALFAHSKPEYVRLDQNFIIAHFGHEADIERKANKELGDVID